MTVNGTQEWRDHLLPCAPHVIYLDEDNSILTTKWLITQTQTWLIPINHQEKTEMVH